MATDYNPFYQNPSGPVDTSYNAAITGNAPDSTTGQALPSTGLWDSLLSNTVGVIWRAASGTVDPWTKAKMQQENQAATTQALGPQVTPQQRDSAIANAWTEVENYLKLQGADPSQAQQGVSSSIKKALGWGAVFLIIALAVFGYSFGKGARVR